MHDWQECKAEEVFDLVGGYAFKGEDFIASGIPVIKIKNIKANHFSEHEFAYVSEEFLGIRKDKLARPNDLLISMSGNRHDGNPETWVGKVAQYRKNSQHFINQRVGALRVKHGANLNTRYAAYVLSSWPYQEHFISIATSSGGQANLSPSQILGVTIPIPPVNEQKAIAAVLGALDDKIELNRRMNATLEGMARALFKSWFVDFAPVCAKMEGKQPFGMDAATAALFPSRLISSSLGDIPEGWEAGRLSDILELLYGKSLTKEDRQSGPYPVYGSGGVTGYNNQALVSGPGIVVGRKGTVGSLYWEDRNFFPIDTVFYVVPKQYFSLVYIFSQLECLGLENMNTDAAVPGLNRENAYRLDIVKPPQSIVMAYTNTALEIRGKIRTNKSEIEKLVKIRDYLLPKLISGDIRIPDVEKFLEAA